MVLLRVLRVGATREYFWLSVWVRWWGREGMDLALVMECCSSSKEMILR